MNRKDSDAPMRDCCAVVARRIGIIIAEACAENTRSVLLSIFVTVMTFVFVHTCDVGFDESMKPLWQILIGIQCIAIIIFTMSPMAQRATSGIALLTATYMLLLRVIFFAMSMSRCENEYNVLQFVIRTCTSAFQMALDAVPALAVIGSALLLLRLMFPELQLWHR
jgi:hypothetical protein